MKTVKLNVFNVNELSNKAKRIAYNSWLQGAYYPWSKENINTLETFENIFPIRVTSWSYDTCSGFIRFNFTEDDDIKYLSGIRLMKYLYNNYFNDIYKGKYFSLWSKKEKSKKNPNVGKLKHRHSKVMFDNCCPLTGYYMDDEILNPIHDFLKNPNTYETFYSLMEKCLNSWVDACVTDYAYCNSMEYFVEESISNGFEYFECGKYYA